MYNILLFKRLFLSLLLICFGLSIIGCELISNPEPAAEKDEDNEGLTSYLSVTCEDLTCNIDTYETYIQNSDIASHVCNMGDGTAAINIMTLEATFDYTYTAADTYTILCEVTDSQNISHIASETVIVGGVTADAGPDQRVSIGDTVTLDGTGSTVRVGENINYSWATMGTSFSVPLDNPRIANPTFIVPAGSSGNAQYQLTVNNGLGESSTPDYVRIYVEPAVISDQR